MPRQARVKSGTGIYHVMLRGINRQDIFEEPEDYWRFIQILSGLDELLAEDLVTRITACHIYAYCLMPNHVHLLICEKDWTIGQCVKSIASSYVRYYNKKNGRCGHLLQDRFKSEPCNDMAYFATLFRYIHQNPVKAGLVKNALDYQYSSWGNDYHHLAPTPVCHTQTVLRRLPLEDWQALVDEPLPATAACLDLSDRKIITDAEVRDHIIQQAGLRTIHDLHLLTPERQQDIIRTVMLDLQCGPRQLSRVSGLNYSLIRKLWKLS